jgi:hypothetical protein
MSPMTRHTKPPKPTRTSVVHAMGLTHSERVTGIEPA